MKHKPFIFSILLMISASTMSCGNTKKSVNDNNLSVMNPYTYATTPEFFEHNYGTREARFFRVIGLADEFYNYRKPDYNGGFFIGLQIASVTLPKCKDEEVMNKITEIGNRFINEKEAFDKTKNIKNYIVYCKRDFSTAQGGWGIPNYYMYYIPIEPPLDISTFDIGSYTGEWLPYAEAWGFSGILPQDLRVRNKLPMRRENNDNNSLNIRLRESYMESQNFINEYIRNTKNFDFEIADRLKKEGKFDTIIHTANSNLYINTDLEVYEQPLGVHHYYIFYKKYAPNRTVQEIRVFLPGVYTSEALPILSMSYSKNKWHDNNYLFDAGMLFPEGVTIEYLVKFLEMEGHLSPDTEDGRATMTINEHVPPHETQGWGATRLDIRSNWQITIDVKDMNNVTIGLLVKHKDDTETVYILDKSSETILKKFKR